MALPGVNPTYQYLDNGGPDGTILGQTASSKVGLFGTAAVQPSGTNQASPATNAAVSISATQWGFTTSTQANAVITCLYEIQKALQNLVFHKVAFTFATADLKLPRSAEMAARKVQDGISLRIWEGADITNDQFPVRSDVLFGFATIYPELACRVWG